MSWLDKSCLHLAVRKKDKMETVTFQVGSSAMAWPGNTIKSLITFLLVEVPVFVLLSLDHL